MKPVARSLLFVPGDRPERFDKAAASGAHEVILDLEDAVAPEAKARAREAVAACLAGGRRAIVRINSQQTPWFEDDLAMLRAAPSATAMLAKAEPESLAATAAALPGQRLIALLETARGWLGLRTMVAVPGLARVAFGSIDFEAETGIADDGEAMTAVRTQIVLESCAAGLQAPIDGVSVGFDDAAAMRGHALRSRQLGFGGKLCIHPRQVAPVNAAWLPTPDEVLWANRVLAAFEAGGGGAIALDGKMVDKPVVDRARRIVADAAAAAAEPPAS
jgi:citrate lyase subunit beta/citryl-CoA lyase